MWVGVGMDMSVDVGAGVLLRAGVEFSVRCIAPTDAHVS
jgi:hypothetical protein